ncbi:MAG: GIY-YIG nuclease family protein [Bacteroidetes bacterium]|nr:GIY-YIG nuclease family protein [Bacteroidota bacterium]
MDDYIVYVLYSESSDSFYIGQTIDIDLRIQQHNSHLFKNANTRKAMDWIIFYKLVCRSRHQAISIENHIKKMKSRRYFENLRKYPEVGNKLLEKYKE